MEKVTLNLGELKPTKKLEKKEEKSKGKVNLYAFLVKKMLNLKVKNNYILINPNYERINFLIEVHFLIENIPYMLLIDGKNKVIVAGGVKLCNIQKIGLDYLKQQISSS